MSAFSSKDRSLLHLQGIDRQTSKGRYPKTTRAPYHQDAGPTKSDLQKGLSALGLNVSTEQLDKLRQMGGTEVLKSIVTLGGDSAAPATAPPSSRAPPTNHTGQTDKRNRESVDGLLQAPLAESKRVVSSGDDRRDTDRVVTGLQSDRHRHFQHRQMGRKKTELHALRSLKAAGPDPATVFKKMQRMQQQQSSRGDSKQQNNDVLSKATLRRGLNELAGVQLSSADLDAVVRKLDPHHNGKEGVTLRQFSQILSKIPEAHKPKTARQARQHHIDAINLTNTRLTEEQRATSHTQRAIASIDAKVSKRFGTEPDRMRRMYMAMESNGDGTISTVNFQKGLKQLGMGITTSEFQALVHQVRNVQSSVNAPSSGDDIYFSDIVHAFEHEVDLNQPTNDMSLNFSPDQKRPTGLKYVSSDVTSHHAHDDATGLPEHHVAVDDHHHRRVNKFDEVPTGKDKSLFRPRPHTAAYRRAIKVKQGLLRKLSEKGRTVADCFIALDSNRDGLITPKDMRKGLMMNLGVQLSKSDLQCLVDHTVERPQGVTYQEFVHALTRDDKYHGYANDKDGTGGGGLLEGPVAAAVGVEAVKHWTGRKEHRGQLSSAMTAKGTVSIGSQYADPHGVGVIGGTLSAREHAAVRVSSVFLILKDFSRFLTDFAPLYLLHWEFRKVAPVVAKPPPANCWRKNCSARCTF